MDIAFIHPPPFPPHSYCSFVLLYKAHRFQCGSFYRHLYYDDMRYAIYITPAVALPTTPP